jgi:hypothetical protein
VGTRCPNGCQRWKFYYNIGLEYGQHGDIPNGVKQCKKAVARGDSNAISFDGKRYSIKIENKYRENLMLIIKKGD